MCVGGMGGGEWCGEHEVHEAQIFTCSRPDSQPKSKSERKVRNKDEK